jgi:hypothetical protein
LCVCSAPPFTHDHIVLVRITARDSIQIRIGGANGRSPLCHVEKICETCGFRVDDLCTKFGRKRVTLAATRFPLFSQFATCDRDVSHSQGSGY